MRLKSKNSEMGRRLANRDETEVERMLSKRPPKFIRDVRASMGMLKRDMTEGVWVVISGGGVCWRWSGVMRVCCCSSRSLGEVMVSSAADSGGDRGKAGDVSSRGEGGGIVCSRWLPYVDGKESRESECADAAEVSVDGVQVELLRRLRVADRMGTFVGPCRESRSSGSRLPTDTATRSAASHMQVVKRPHFLFQLQRLGVKAESDCTAKRASLSRRPATPVSRRQRSD